jgi:hypothetical protein
MDSINNLLAEQVAISKEQHLSDLKELYPLPIDAIIHKRIPGLGATHGEMKAPRNSIIVLPNRPVIEGKVAKHNKYALPANQILGVHKGTSLEEISDYLSNPKISHKKILVTPESYAGKFKTALGDHWEYIKQHYYLLIDECERTIQDKDYRDKISAPFDDFFSFKNKGLISATTLPFSDPRFEELSHFVVVPDYSYKKPLTLITTNNVVAAFRAHLKEKPSDRYFIFLSSIKTIAALVEAMNIEKETVIHCSESKAQALKLRGFKSSHSFNKDKLAKYNFFTSRFYSGLDMTLEYKADVIMVTDVNFAEHSILDPQTEVIQIVGRFRNGCNSITHITNFNKEIRYKTSAQIKEYLAGQQEVYKQILKIKENCKTQGGFDAIKQILTLSPFGRFFNNDGSYNWFMYDNHLQEQRVISLYQAPEKLIAAYKLVNDHFEVTVDGKKFPFSDEDRMRRQSTQSRKAEIKEVVKQLVNMKPQGKMFAFYNEEEYNDLITEYPTVVKAYNLIGEDGIKQADYTESKIQRALIAQIEDDKYYLPAVSKDILAEFKVGYVYKETKINEILTTIYMKHNLKGKVKASDIKRYFVTKRTTVAVDGRNQHAYNLLSKIESL